MGTADYCLIVVALFFGLLAFSIMREEKRRRDRRKGGHFHPGGIDHRNLAERRASSWAAYLSWAMRSPFSRMKHWF
jgi:hypothetical protein